jgi:RNA polymerase sigma factor (sigma-70 family)
MIEFEPVSATRYGDSNSMDRLTRSFLEARDDLLRFLKRRGRRGAAEDIVQNVWLKLRERGSDPQSWEEPRAVLFTTAANLKIDAHRREAVAEEALGKEAALLQEIYRPEADPEAQADAAGRLERLSTALAQLPPQCRQAFLMNRIGELTHAQIAASLGISTKTVQRHIERALRLCVQVLE